MSNQIRCVLEKSLLTATARCRHGRSFEVGERLGYECLSTNCASQCRSWLQRLREHSRFIFGRDTQPGQPLTNHQEIRLQCGGVLGLSILADETDTRPIADVSSLLNAIIKQYGDIDDIPLQPVVTTIAAHDPRPHRKRNNR